MNARIGAPVAVAMTLVCSAFAAAEPAGAGFGAAKAGAFTFASWNVGHYALGDDFHSHLTPAEARERGKAYRAFLDEVGADFLGICEFSGNFSEDGSVKALDAVFSRYADSRVGFGSDTEWRCNAQAWNGFECVTSRVRAFERRRDPDVFWLESRMRRGPEEIVFAQVHLDWNTLDKGFEDVRACQFRELIAAYRDEPHVVISGDFNVGVRKRDASGRRTETVDDPSEYRVFAEAGFTLGNDGRFLTSQHGIASGGRKGCALDNIIVRGLKIRDFRTWDRYDLSDHALVSATLELEPVLPHPVVMMRFSSAQTRSPEEWKGTAKAFAANPRCCDEVWFSTGESFPSVGWHRGNAARIAAAAADLRALGIGVSLQFEATIGHGDNFPTAEEKAIFDKPWTGWTGPDGTECRYCNCPRQPGFLRRLAEVSEIYAAVRPSVVWIDDDLRYRGHDPVSGREGPGCWCAKCVADFAAEEGRAWTRESLRAAHAKDEALRARWLDFSSRSLAAAACTIARAFRKVSPRTRVGLQTGPDRNPLTEVVVRALVKETGERSCVRMGAGAYYDLSPYEQLAKSRDMVANRARLDLENEVDNWCTEIESYPRAYGSRSIRSIALEAFSSIGWGFDTASLFVMDRRSETDETYSKYLLAPLAHVTQFLNAYCAANRGTSPAGFTCPFEAGDTRCLCGIPVLPGRGVSWGVISAEREAFGGLGAVWGDFRADRVPDFEKTPSAKLQAVRDRVSGLAPLKVCSPFVGLVLPRVTGSGALRTVGLVGTRLDPQADIVLRIDTAAKRVRWRELGSAPVELPLVAADVCRQVTIPALGPWSLGYLELED